MSKGWIFLFLILLAVGISLLVPGVQKRIVELSVAHGYLSLGNKPPEVPVIYIDKTDCMTGTCSFTGTAGQAVSMEVTAKIRDDNGNCDGFSAPTAYLCVGTGPCNAGTKTHTLTLSTLQSHYDESGNPSDNGIYCNYTGTISIEYYETPGDWKVNVTVYDGEYYASNASSWTNGEIVGFKFPLSGDTINFGSLDMGTWNDALPKNGNGNISWNTGNVKLNITWNATNFTETTHTPPAPEEYTIPIGASSPSNFIIDNDGTRGGGSGFEEYLIENTPIEAYPSGGFGICTSHDCSGTPGKQPIYWHLYIGTGKREGDYQNDIVITAIKYG